MTIREIEWKSGLERTNIRFYEREGLLNPVRRENGYRDYSEDNLALLQKIKLLRRLGFSLDAIRSLKDGDTALEEAIQQRLASVGVQRRELNATEQVCQEMQKDKAMFSTLDAEHYLRSYDRALSPPATIRPTVPESDRILPVRCPWRRFFARSLDLALIGFISLSFMALVFRINVGQIPGILDWILGLVEWGILIAVEGFLLSRFGTTPGKWVMGIRVEHADGRLLTFQESVGRAWQVFGRGSGYTIPFYDLYRNWKSYKAVTEGDGPEWDEDVLLVVRDYAWWRPVVCAGILVAGFALGVNAALVPSMPKHRGPELTVDQFVENYNQLVKYYGIESQPLLTDGSFQERENSPNTIVIDLNENDPVVLQFTEENGILTKIFFERDIFTPFYGIYFDPAGQEAIMVSTMAYSWANAGLWEARGSADLLDELTSHKDGVWQENLFGTRICYTVTPLGESLDEDGAFSGESFKSSFSIERLSDPEN